MKNSITTLPKVNNTLWGRVRLALTIMTLFAMASSTMAQDDEGVSNVNFPPSDTEAKIGLSPKTTTATSTSLTTATAASLT